MGLYQLAKLVVVIATTQISISKASFVPSIFRMIADKENTKFMPLFIRKPVQTLQDDLSLLISSIDKSL